MGDLAVNPIYQALVDDAYDTSSDEDAEEILRYLYKDSKRKFDRYVRVPAIRVNLDLMDTATFLHQYRFTRRQLERITIALKLPEVYVTSSRYKFPRLEAICILLHRLAYPTRIVTLVITYGRSKSSISELINELSSFIYFKCKQLLRFNLNVFSAKNMERYALAIYRRSHCLDKCIGFVDATVKAILSSKRRSACSLQWP
jgi:hypothetical protein